MRHVITLSTIPPRFSQLGPVLASLAAQRSRPEAVELYIPRSYRRFPQWGGGLPEVPEGITIVRVDEDFGPASKVLPAARIWRGQEVELIYIDDDQICAPNWAEGFLQVRREHPEAAVCASINSVKRIGRNWEADSPQPRAVRAPESFQQLGYQLRNFLRTPFRRKDGLKLVCAFRKLDRTGYADIAQGFTGVALRPDFFDETAFQIPPVVWAVDDVWLSGHLARRGIPIWADQRLDRITPIANVVHTASLRDSTIDGADRDGANLACVDYFRDTYGIWGGSASQSA